MFYDTVSWSVSCLCRRVENLYLDPEYKCASDESVPVRAGWIWIERLKRTPLTILAVWLVLMLRVGQGQRRVGATGQAGVAAGLHTPAPETHGTLRWHHPLVLIVHVWACANRVATVGESHLGAEGQATACGWFTYSQLPQVKVLTCRTYTCIFTQWEYTKHTHASLGIIKCYTVHKTQWEMLNMA